MCSSDLQQNEQVAEQFMENRKRISIYGVQEKLSLFLDKNINIFGGNNHRVKVLILPDGLLRMIFDVPTVLLFVMAHSKSTMVLLYRSSGNTITTHHRM